MARFRTLISSIAEYAFLFLYVAPILKYKKELAPEFTVAHGFGSLLLTSKFGFLKLATSKKASLHLEYANYIRVLDARPDLANILPALRFVKTAGLEFLVCENMSKIPPGEVLGSAVALYRHFLQPNIPNLKYLKLTDCCQIEAGIRQVEAELPSEAVVALQSNAETFLACGKYTTGFAHGDFHSRNIMRDLSGNARLIDLDCIRLKAIIEFDALYFSLEQEWSISGQVWTETLAECFRSRGQNIATVMTAFSAEWSNGLGIAFLLDRIGQEFLNYGTRYRLRHLTGTVKAAMDAVNQKDLVSDQTIRQT